MSLRAASSSSRTFGALPLRERRAVALLRFHVLERREPVAPPGAQEERVLFLFVLALQLWHCANQVQELEALAKVLAGEVVAMARSARPVRLGVRDVRGVGVELARFAGHFVHEGRLREHGNA